ncbi:MAG: hypothetical protein WCY70_03475 [Methanoculleus sp.]
MKQVQIILSIVLTLALCYAVILAAGGLETGDQNRTVGVEPVVAGGVFVSQDVVNTTNRSGDGAFEESGPASGRTAMPHNAVPVAELSGSGGAGGGSSGASPPTPTPAPLVKVSMVDSGITVNTITVFSGTTVKWVNNGDTARTVTGTETNASFDSGLLNPGDSFTHMFTAVGNYTCTSLTTGETWTVIVTPVTTPTVDSIPSPGDTSPSPSPTTTTQPVPSTPIATSTPEPTIDEIDPIPTTEIITEEWTGTAGVTRTYYYIIDHDTRTTSIVAESEFPAGINNKMMYYELCDHVYHFSNIELRNIYLHFHILNYGPNGERNEGGPSIDSRFGYEAWLDRWEYPVAESVILIYSEDSPMYVVSTINFVQNAFMRDPYIGEEDYIPRNYYGKQEIMPEKQPGKPRYYDLPPSVPLRLYREGRLDNPYLPVTPAPELEIDPISTQEPTQLVEPTFEQTSAPTPTLTEETIPEPTQVSPAVTGTEGMIWEPTPTEEPSREENPALTPETTLEPPEEDFPVEGGSEAG